MTTIIFIRHGQTETNISNKWSGTINAKLSEIGIKQSNDILNKINVSEIDAIYCSPLARAQYMGEIISLQANKKLFVDERLIERNFGSLEGCPVISNQKTEMGSWNSNSDLEHEVEKIQSMYNDRIKPFLVEMLEKYENRKIVVVAHSWVGRLFAFYFSGEKDYEILHKSPKNGEPVVFKI